MADIDGSIRGLRVVTAAMVVSLVTLAAIAVVFRTQFAPSFGSAFQNGLLTAAGLLALGCAAAYRAVNRQTLAELERKPLRPGASAEPLAAVLEPYRRLAVLRAALIEAPGMLALLAYLVGGHEAGLLIPGASALLLLASMPSREALQRFADGLRE